MIDRLLGINQLDEEQIRDYRSFQTMLQKRTWIQMQKVRDQYQVSEEDLEMIGLKTILERDLFKIQTNIKWADYINALRVEKIIEGKGNSNRRRKIKEFDAEKLEQIILDLNKRSINSLYEEWLTKRGKK